MRREFMYQLCQKKSSSKNTSFRNIKKPVFGQEVCQMYCSYCRNPRCNNGSICGHRDILGTYGHRKAEQRYFGVTGRTHEAEHAVGFEAANRHNNFRRDSSEGRVYENALPAYQEEYRFHRAHIGTGNRNRIDASGFNSQTYRDAQQVLIDNGDFATAVQVNQLGYAFLPGFSDAPYGTIADQSFLRMVQVPNVPVPNVLVQDGEPSYIPKTLTIDEKVEMCAARYAARTRKWPTKRDIRRIRTEVRRGKLL